MKAVNIMTSIRNTVFIEPVYLNGDSKDITEANNLAKLLSEEIALAKRNFQFNCHGSDSYCVIKIQAVRQKKPCITVKAKSIQCYKLIDEFLRNNSFLE